MQVTGQKHWSGPIVEVRFAKMDTLCKALLRYGLYIWTRLLVHIYVTIRGYWYIYYVRYLIILLP